MLLTEKSKTMKVAFITMVPRYYNNSELSMWLSTDPMADKYPSLSSYVYCANNPVILIDPNGEEMDDYKLIYHTGKIQKLKDQSHAKKGVDRIIAVPNSDSEVFYDNNDKPKHDYIEFEKGNGTSIRKNYNVEGINGELISEALSVKIDKSSKDYLPFFVNNTNVEWSRLELDGVDVFTTSHAEHEEPYGAFLMKTFLGNSKKVPKLKVSSHTHSHSGTPTTTPISPADRKTSSRFRSEYGNDIRFKVYFKQTKEERHY